MFLVTTSIEETWPKNEKILFLGEWCKKFEKRSIWKSLDQVTLEDPWSNRHRRRLGYEYTLEVYEKVMLELTKELNIYHFTDKPVRFWKILCGPWLKLFINSTYHSWECINDAKNNKGITNTLILKNDTFDYLPQDMQDFESLMVKDSWRHYICGLVIKENNSIKFDDLDCHIKEMQYAEIFPKRQGIRKHLYFFVKLFSRFLNRSDTIFIHNPYISRSVLLKLIFKLHSIPHLSSGTPTKMPKNINSNWRKDH